MQLDLFNDNTGYTTQKFDIIDGNITLIKNYLPQSTLTNMYNSLIKTIPWSHDEIQMYGKTMKVPRLQCWFGTHSYSYSGIYLPPKEWLPELLQLKNLCENLSGYYFTNALVNLYRTGDDCVHWHADDERELGTHPPIVSVSLGTQRKFQLKHKFDTTIKQRTIPLSHGDIIIMEGATQQFWYHRIPREKGINSNRINITFRKIISIN